MSLAQILGRKYLQTQRITTTKISASCDTNFKFITRSKGKLVKTKLYYVMVSSVPITSLRISSLNFDIDEDMNVCITYVLS